MTLVNNINFIKAIELRLEELLPIKLGVNKRNELVRLVYEISRAQDLSVDDIFSRIDIEEMIEEGKSGLFHKVKTSLMNLRYPSRRDENNVHIMPFKASDSKEECSTWEFNLAPKAIFVEKEVKDLEWTHGFLENFREAELTFIDDAKEHIEKSKTKSPLELYNSRRDNVFLIKNKHAFIKICPCTKEARRCGYWI
ncbi:hypothetical protein ACFL4E_03850, partial [Candidatus Omnitrophota bacterium]